mmetsp:Transcript_24688/g.85196  ORF Transcript_24688/g.85196 Transcript_24688/m.85196 type:complete len:103 (+) Transcript_24688:349-657(+)
MSMALYMYTLAVGHTLGTTLKLFIDARTLTVALAVCLAFKVSVITLWSVASRGPGAYMYRQEREWTVSQQRRDDPSGAYNRAPLLGAGRRQRGGEIVAVRLS